MTRRKIIWLIAGGFAVLTAAIASMVALPSGVLFLLRRRLPQSILEPSSVLRLGTPSDFAIGVDTRFLESHRVWVVRNATRLYVLYARCTHQGCTPDWVAPENKFRCPCHESRFCIGSAFDGNGINCEGPAPCPLDRVHVEVDSAGQAVADLSKLYQWPKGERSQFDEPGAFIPLNQGGS
jgi:cytochrome b6-f complex iron-sulfur subunit